MLAISDLIKLHLSCSSNTGFSYTFSFFIPRVKNWDGRPNRYLEISSFKFAPVYNTTQSNPKKYTPAGLQQPVTYAGQVT